MFVAVFREPEDINDGQGYHKRIKFYVRQVNPNNYRTVLKAIRQKDIFNVIVDIGSTKIHMFLRAVSACVSLLLLLHHHLYS